MWSKLSTRDVAYVAVFAALSVIVIKLVPGFPIIGLSERDIKFNAALAPIYGMVLGPYLGFLSAFIGDIVVVDNVFSVFISFSRAISAFVAGLLSQKSYRLGGRVFPGWSVAAAVLSLLILGWYSTWVGQQVPYFPILHIAGLLVILVTRGWIATVFKKCEQKGQRWTANLFYLLSGISIIVLAYVLPKLSFSSIDFFPYLILFLYLWGGIMVLYGLFGVGIRRENFTAAICLASYCSIITDHMIGNLAYIVLLSPTPESFIAALPVSAVERSIFTAIATVVGVGVILALRRSGLFNREL